MSRKKELQQDIKGIKKELEDASALAVYAGSEGGKKLLDGFIDDIIGDVESLAMKCQSLSHIEFIGIGLNLKNKMDVIKALRNAKANRFFLAGELKRKLKQAEEEFPDDEDVG